MQNPLKTRITTVKLADLKLLEKNARYMANDEFQRLVDNIKNDGKLTSLPLIYKGEVLSGNHRVMAAIKAGLEEAEALEIVSEITDDHKKAIILSHNAITGKDDMSILKEIFDSIESLDMKEYSAITENLFKGDELNLDSLSFAQPIHEEVLLAFLPEDFGDLLTSLKEIEKKYKGSRLMLTADIKDFDAIAKAVTQIKSQKNVINTSFAFKILAQTALEYLEKTEVSNASE